MSDTVTIEPLGSTVTIDPVGGASGVQVVPDAAGTVQVEVIDIGAEATVNLSLTVQPVGVTATQIGADLVTVQVVEAVSSDTVTIRR